MRLIVTCPAKINLFLAVGPRERSGYHPVRTEMQAVGLFDELEIEDDVDETCITSDWDGLPAQNTLTMALSLLSEILRVPSLRIHLTKRIPTESGLGGGSSDAAGLLRGVARMTGINPSPSELSTVAAAIGSDVPFFLVGGRAKATGHGEQVDPLPDQPKEWALIAMGSERCPTRETYAKLDMLSYSWRDFPAGRELYNDFERVAPCESLDIIEALRATGAHAGLSGSGAAAFGLFPTEREALKAQETLAPMNVESWIAPTLTRAESTAIGQR